MFDKNTINDIEYENLLLEGLSSTEVSFLQFLYQFGEPINEQNIPCYSKLSQEHYYKDGKRLIEIGILQIYKQMPEKDLYQSISVPRHLLKDIFKEYGVITGLMKQLCIEFEKYQAHYHPYTNYQPDKKKLSRVLLYLYESGKFRISENGKTEETFDEYFWGGMNIGFASDISELSQNQKERKDTLSLMIRTLRELTNEGNS